MAGLAKFHTKGQIILHARDGGLTWVSVHPTLDEAIAVAEEYAVKQPDEDVIIIVPGLRINP